MPGDLQRDLMEQRDDVWTTSVEITADSKAALIKKTAAVNRLLKQLDKERVKPRRAKGEGGLFKRADGMWVGRVDLPPGPDGKRRRSKPVYSADRGEAVVKLQKVKEEIEKGFDQVDKRVTVEAWLTRWIEEIAKPRMRPQPWKSYRSMVNNQIIPALGSRPLANLKPEHIRHLHRHILESTYTRRDKETGEKVEHHYTTRTVEAAHNVLSVALNDAVSEGLIHRNVCEVVTKPQVVSESRGALTSDQARAVLRSAMEHNDRMVTRWAAGLLLGGRQGEILGLQWDRVDLENGTLDLAWQLEWLPLKKDAEPDDPKRFDVRPGFEHIPLWRGAALTRPKTQKSQRMIPLPAPLAAVLKAYKATAQPNPWDLVWVSANTTPISDRDDREAWADALARAEVPDVQVHAMRGTTATLLLEAGVDAHVIAAILGHADIVTTRGYQHVNLKLARDALGNLDGLLALD
ncbi:tyrosine-type recombinase/integrase [Nocardia otitidiscaviarum]|uniref:tyrosine-type recombinase/integrase n=1 Tax=Nocardia otitidiscaviarum TaxID=1823 RepID=UPI002B4B7085|nr:site-specific integrase [Nocardia otitidiscaviarum]